MELLMMIDAAKTAGAEKIYTIVPYYAYARSDKKDAPRISITGKLLAQLIKAAGADYFMSMLFHAPQVHGFFDIPVDVLSSRLIHTNYLQKKNLRNTIIISPDVGGSKSAAKLAQKLGLPSAALNKVRKGDNEVEVYGLVGEQIQGCKRAIIYDDEISTGGTTIETIKLIESFGIDKIWVVTTHGVFAKDALNTISTIKSVKKIIVTDTIPVKHLRSSYSKLKVLSVAPAFGEAIRCNFEKRSIGNLYVYAHDA
jgi:ribose-phosphate pyrophosphokinase